MAANRTKLTKTLVASLPADRAGYFWDSELRGFGVRVAPGGTKTFIFQRRIGKTDRRISIGRADAISAENARRKALLLAADFAAGNDPVAIAKTRAARTMSLRQAFEDYKAAPKKKGGGRGLAKKARTIRDIEKAQRRIDDWMDMPVTDITGRMVKERHAHLAETSPAQANLVMRYLRAALNHVIADTDEDEEPVLARNPVERLNRINQWAEVRPKKTHVSEDRLADWIEAVRTSLTGLSHEHEARDALLFYLLTGARFAEVLGNAADGYLPLRWSDVDLERGIVTFAETKNRREHELPLPAQAIELLWSRRYTAGRDFVFSDRRGAILTDLRSAYSRIEEATGLWITAHDLRRTFASVANRLDIANYKIKRLLNHVSGGDVTEGYITVSLDEQREAIQRIADYILHPARRQHEQVIALEARR